MRSHAQDLETKAHIWVATQVVMKVLSMNVSSIDERAHEAMLQQVLRVNLWMCSAKMGKYIKEFALHLVCHCATNSLGFAM